MSDFQKGDRVVHCDDTHGTITEDYGQTPNGDKWFLIAWDDGSVSTERTQSFMAEARRGMES